MVGHKTNRSKFKRLKIILSISSKHDGINIGNKQKKKIWEIHKYVKINTLMNNQQEKKKRNHKENNQKTWDEWEISSQIPKPMWCN